MSNLLQLSNAHKAYGARDLFTGAGFAINAGEHVGVIGPNGAGKTTLFKILMGEEDLDHGEVIKSRELRLGYLEQHDNWKVEDSVENYLSRHSQVPLWDLKAWARGLGLPLDFFERPMASLSGGYKMRCKLLKLMSLQPNLMLLDEPTNYLDLETLLYLENFLREYRGAFLLISHDREFLKRTTDHILEVEAGEMTKYNGSLEDYFEQKALLRTQLESRAMSLDAKRKETLDFVNRFGAKASKARQAQSRLKALDKMETIDLKPLPVKAKVKLPSHAPLPKLVYRFEKVNLGYGEKSILTEVETDILKGDRIGVVGFNGAGKSTLLKALAGLLPAQSGSFSKAENAKLGYFSQHVAENLNVHWTIHEELSQASDSHVTTQDVLNTAGSLLFSGEDVKKKISVLSGGEKSRVALGKLLLSGASVLVMDEPTNHLDFDTVEALGEALQKFSGVLVVVSHDRSFIKRVSNKILEVRDGRVRLYPGTYEEYVWSLQKGCLASLNQETVQAQPKTLVPSSSGAPQKLRLDHRRIRELEASLRKIDKKIEVLRKELAELDAEIAASSGAWNKDFFERRSALERDLSAHEDLWIEVSEDLETQKALGLA